MRRAIVALSIIVFCACGAAAAEPPKLTMSDVINLLAGLRNLDGHAVVVKQQGGAESTVIVPWEFSSGTLRLKIASDINIAAGNERILEDARQTIVKEILAKMPPDKDGRPQTTILPNTPEFEVFQRQFKEVLDSPARGAMDLARIKASELRLDRNEIPVTVLAALGPILDLDVIDPPQK